MSHKKTDDAHKKNPKEVRKLKHLKNLKRIGNGQRHIGRKVVFPGKTKDTQWNQTKKPVKK